MNDILYCFVSHEKKIKEDLEIIPKMMKKLNYDDYIIVYGGSNCETELNNKVIGLECNDLYCDLPEKINALCKYLVLTKYKYFVKLDRTVLVKKPLIVDDLVFDYYGFILESVPHDPNYGRYHFGRCDEKSEWLNREFHAEYIKYCSGIAYVLSKKAVEYISQDNKVYTDNIYEDYYVGYLLNTHNIKPEYIPIKDYFYDQEHPEFFI